MYLGLDLGTSSVKALLIDELQSAVASTQAPLKISRPVDGWSEQDPADWISATGIALRALAVHAPLSAVKSIGLSGQMHGATVLGVAGDVLRPCILWNDTRSHVEAAAMDADPRFRDISGNIVFPGFTAPKLQWLRTHEPDVYARIAKVVLPKDYLRLWLTGTYASDMSDAAGTAWLDTGARTWSDTLLAASGMERAQMPDLIEGNAVSGELRAAIADEFGLPRGIPVAGGAGDNAASAVGVGAVRGGEAFVSLGTSGVLFAATDGYFPDPATALHTFCHALPGQWHQMGVILAATDALEWFGRLVGATPAELGAQSAPLRAPGRTVFLPYLGGERTPHNDAKVRGAFLGLDHATDRSGAARAVMEGVAFAFRDSLDAMRATGTAPSRLVAVGGGSRSDYWLNVIATALDLPVAVPVEGDYGAAFGAARLGMMAVERCGAELATPPEIDRWIEPETRLTAAFETAHRRYRAAYAALKELS